MPRIRYKNQRVTFVGQGRAGSIRTAELDQQRMCNEKKSYTVFADAQLACWDLANYEREQGRVDSAARLHVYLCPYGNHYHVGHSTGCVLVTPMLSSDTHKREGNGMGQGSDAISQDVMDRFITAIGEKGGGISSKDGRVGLVLSAMTGVTGSRVARILNRMADRDHKLIKLDRGKNPGTKRTYNVWLTDAGTARWIELQEHAERGAAPPEPPALVTNDTDVTNDTAHGQHGQRDMVGVVVADLTPDTPQMVDKSGVVMTPAEVAEVRGETNEADKKAQPQAQEWESMKQADMVQVNFRVPPDVRKEMQRRARKNSRTMQDEYNVAVAAYLTPTVAPAKAVQPVYEDEEDRPSEAEVAEMLAAAQPAPQPTAQDIAAGMLAELRRLWEQEQRREQDLDAARVVLEKYGALQTERDGLVKQLQDWETKEVGWKKEMQRLEGLDRDEFDKLRAELDRVGNDLNHANRVIAAKQGDIERFRTELDAAKAEVERLRQKANDASFLSGMGAEELARLVQAGARRK